MRTSSWLIALFSFLQICRNVSLLSESICLDKGYDSTVLLCNTCDKILDIVGDEELVTDCKACCHVPVEQQKFKIAVIEIDKRFMMGLPELSSVIKSAKKLKLKVRYTFGARPTLLMYKSEDDDLPLESIAVHSWSKDTFQDYLSAHLQK